VAYPSATLGDYKTELRTLVHDPGDVYWTVTQKEAAINRAIQQRDVDTAANREIIELTLDEDEDTYTLTDLGNDRVFDVVGINLLVGSTRVVLGNVSYTQLNARYRPFTGAQSLPVAWAKYNPTTIIFGPKPGVAYDTEWDCCLTSENLEGDDDTDVLIGKYTVPVPFYAAYLLKFNERQYAEADVFLDAYYKRIATCQGGRAGLLPTAYPTSPIGGR